MKKLLILLLVLVSIHTVYAREIYYTEYNDLLFEDYIDVPVVAISEDREMGIIGRVRIALLEGTGKIVFDERTYIDFSTLESVVDAVEFAENYTGEKHNYFISYDLHSDSVSGKSTGAAVSTGIIALISNKSIKKDWLITGPIDKKGNLMQTGGVSLKVLTAGSQHFDRLYIPENQSRTQIYEKQRNRIMTHDVDLKDIASSEYNMNVVETKNLKEIISSIIV